MMRLDAAPPLMLFSAVLSVCSGCAAHEQILKAPSSGFVWVQFGTDNHGCALFTKKATTAQVLVDTAIWYRNAQGKYTLDAHSCAPPK